VLHQLKLEHDDIRKGSRNLHLQYLRTERVHLDYIYAANVRANRARGITRD